MGAPPAGRGRAPARASSRSRACGGTPRGACPEYAYSSRQTRAHAEGNQAVGDDVRRQAAREVQLVEGREARHHREQVGGLLHGDTLAELALRLEPPRQLEHPRPSPVLERGDRRDRVGVDAGHREQRPGQLGARRVDADRLALRPAERLACVRVAGGLHESLEARHLAQALRQRDEQPAPRLEQLVHGRPRDAGPPGYVVDPDGGQRPVLERGLGGIEDPGLRGLAGRGPRPLDIATFVHVDSIILDRTDCAT